MQRMINAAEQLSQPLVKFDAQVGGGGGGGEDNTDRKITRNQKRKHDEINHVQELWD